MIHGGKTWKADPNHANFEAAINATEYVYNVKPDLIRDGGSIPVLITLQVMIMYAIYFYDYQFFTDTVYKIVTIV